MSEQAETFTETGTAGEQREGSVTAPPTIAAQYVPRPSHLPPVRPIAIVGDRAVVSLTKGQSAIIDVADVPLVEGRSWYAHAAGGGFYAAREESGRVVYMHRLVTDAPLGMVVDHLNHDTLDNRRINLCVCTQSENLSNRLPNARNKTGFRGVFKHGRRWRSSIADNGKTRHLGPFDTPEAASEAYESALAAKRR